MTSNLFASIPAHAPAFSARGAGNSLLGSHPTRCAPPLSLALSLSLSRSLSLSLSPSLAAPPSYSCSLCSLRRGGSAPVLPPPRRHCSCCASRRQCTFRRSPPPPLPISPPLCSLSRPPVLPLRPSRPPARPSSACHPPDPRRSHPSQVTSGSMYLTVPPVPPLAGYHWVYVFECPTCPSPRRLPVGLRV